MRSLAAERWADGIKRKEREAVKNRFVWMWLSLLSVGSVSTRWIAHTKTPEHANTDFLFVLPVLAMQGILLAVSWYWLNRSLESPGKRKVLKECLVNGFLAWAVFMLFTVFGIFIKGPDFLETWFAVIWLLCVFAVCPAIILKRPFQY